MAMEEQTPYERDLKQNDPFNKNDYEYIHFENDHHREIYLLNNPQVKVARNCCGGKGIAIEKRNPPIRIKYVPQIEIKGTCDICFLDDVELLKACNTCSQPFCRCCLEKIVSKVCPYCRGKLRNNL
jgi:hypothetical protein